MGTYGTLKVYGRYIAVNRHANEVMERRKLLYTVRSVFKEEAEKIAKLSRGGELGQQQEYEWTPEVHPEYL